MSSSRRPRRWFTRLFGQKAKQEHAAPFHAVAIRCSQNACQAAKDSQLERHLSAEAPLLPLPQCDRPEQCQCRYQHFEDRRSGSRRTSEGGLTNQSNSDREERRRIKSRRAEDSAEESEPFSVHEDSYYEHVGDTIRTEMIDLAQSDGVDPYNSGTFDRSKSWKPGSRK